MADGQLGPATNWVPATAAEGVMARALGAGDQRTYFRHVLTIPLYLPVPSGAAATWPPVDWATWSDQGRTFVLVFTSPQALAMVMADDLTAGPPVRYHEIVAARPDPDWWIALDPGLPLDAYFPANLAGPLSTGAVRLPDMEDLGAPAEGPGEEGPDGND
jgi:hypothetical protein